MNINDLVSGRLYKVANKLSASDYEANEDLAMFLRLTSKKASVLTISGEYKIVSLDKLQIPEKDYMDVFNENTISNFSNIMKQFFSEYQKYDNIKYSKKNGFKSNGISLVKLNNYQKELNNLNILPIISLAVKDYFEVYKELGVSFNSLEDIIIDFAYIPEWEESFNALRGFDFSNKRLSPKKIKKYTNEALMLHHLYTNLFLSPNFKNIKAEWLDLLIDKFKKHSSSINTNDNIINTINSIKWKCMIENTIGNNTTEKKENIKKENIKRIDFNL